MRFSTANAKWCIGFIIFTVVNVHISLMFLRSYEKQKSHKVDDPEYSRLAAKYARLTKELSEARTYAQIRNNVNLIPEYVNQRPVASNVSLAFPSSEVVLAKKYTTVEELDFTFEKSGLPAFAADESEFLFSSVIERASSSWSLHLTIFMLSHHMLQPMEIATGIEKVHPFMKETWRRAANKVRSTKYSNSGFRIMSEPMFCRIANSATGVSYVVEGAFIPNRLAADSNSNRRMDIFRCRMQQAEESYNRLAGTGEKVYVEILRGETSLLNFTVPWSSRRTGFLLSSPPAATKLNAWKGYNISIKSEKPAVAAQDKLHICVPGTKQLPSRRSMSYFLEFVSHHLLLGADHIHLPIALSWSSENMAVFVRIFHSYIEEGKLSIYSQAGDGLDMILSIGGLSWHRVAMKIFQTNMCLYLAKGTADYVAVLDIDELFIPKGRYTNLIDVLRSTIPSRPLPQHPPATTLNSLATEWTREVGGGRGPGWADKDAHPYCFIGVTSEVVTNRRTNSEISPLSPWMGQRYPHGTESLDDRASRNFAYHRAILPTDLMFSASLIGGGACRLDWEWTTCKAQPKPFAREDEFCMDRNSPTKPRRKGFLEGGRDVDFRMDHDFDEVVLDNDAQYLNPQTELVVHHYLMYHASLSVSDYAMQNKSIYTTDYFPKVLLDLQSRGLDLVMMLRDQNQPPLHTTVEQTWSKLFTPEDIKAAALAGLSDPSARMQAPTVVKIFPPLPNNFSNRAIEDEISLPNFAKDYSEFLLGAMIERVSDSWDLYLTSFFLCHWLLEPKIGGSASGGVKLHPAVTEVWSKAMLNFEVGTDFLKKYN
jgi:hypothetical protein